MVPDYADLEETHVKEKTEYSYFNDYYFQTGQLIMEKKQLLAHTL